MTLKFRNDAENAVIIIIIIILGHNLSWLPFYSSSHFVFSLKFLIADEKKYLACWFYTSMMWQNPLINESISH